MNPVLGYPQKTPGFRRPSAANPSGTDADLERYLSAAYRAAGSAVQAAHRSALLALVLGLKADGLWDLLDWVWPCAGPSLASALVPLKHPGPSLRAATATGFTSGDYSPPLGLTGGSNAQAKRLDVSGVNVGAARPRSAGYHLAVYATRFSVPTGSFGGIDIASQPAGVYLYCWDKFTNYGRPRVSITGAGEISTSPSYALPTTPEGLFLIQAAGSRQQVYHRADRVHDSAAGAPNAATTLTLFSYGTTANLYSANTLGFASLGATLSPLQVKAYHARLEDFAAALGRRAAPPQTVTALNGVVVAGQSLALGTLGAGYLDGYQAYGHQMFGNGVVPSTAAGAAVGAVAPLLDFPAANALGATPYPPWGNSLGPKAPGHGLFFAGCPVSGTAYSGLKKGTTPYAASIDHHTQAYSIAAGHGLAYTVRAVGVVHGETDDGNNSATYAADLAEWQADYDGDLKAVTGQSEDVVLFCSQNHSWTKPFGGKSTSTVAQAMLAAHAADPGRIVLCCPKYFLTHGDGLHLNTATYAWLGEYYAKAYKAVVVDGGSFSPLRPVSVTRSGSTITVVFNRGGLVLDTTLVSDPSGSQASKNHSGAVVNVTNYKGFEFVDDKAGGPSAVVTGLAVTTTTLTDDTLTVTLDTTPDGLDNPRLRYAFTGVAGSNGGPTTGPRGNLRDSDASFASVYGNTLYNWCVTFDEAVT